MTGPDKAGSHWCPAACSCPDIDGVGEIAHGVIGIEPVGDQYGANARTGQIAGLSDAIVQFDLIGIDRQVEVGAQLVGKTSRKVEGLFRRQRLCAERVADWGAGTHRLGRDEGLNAIDSRILVGRLGEGRLGQGGRVETVADRAPDREIASEVIARGELAVDRVAGAVVIMFGAARNRDEPARDWIEADVDIGGIAIRARAGGGADHRAHDRVVPQGRTDRRPYARIRQWPAHDDIGAYAVIAPALR